MTNPIKYLFTAVSCAFVFCLDQASKILVHTQMEMGKPLTLIEGFFNIAYIGNAGGAFGIFNESSESIRVILFKILPLLCVLYIFILLKNTQNRFQIAALSWILGGAAGNYFDRLRLSYVIDFIDWHFKGWHWPTFNIADSFIVTGVCILLFFYIQEEIQDRRKKKEQQIP